MNKILEMNDVEKMRKIPVLIWELNKKRIKKVRELLETKDKMEKIKREIEREVYNEVDEKGKKIYSNEAMRKNEIGIRLENEKFKSLENKYREIKFEIEEIENDVEFLKNVQENTKVLM